MDMQHKPMGNMPMGNMHNTFWRNDQITIVFRSDVPLVSGDVVRNKQRLLTGLDLPTQLNRLNTFLKGKVPVSLSFLDDSDQSGPGKSLATGQDTLNVEDSGNLPAGVYLFGLTTPIQSRYGEINTSVVSFLKFTSGTSRGTGESVSEVAVPGLDQDDDDKGHSKESLVAKIVRFLNDGLEDLNRGMHVPITFAAPVWLTGGTGNGVNPFGGGPGSGQGCPLTPPMPVKDSCSNWHIKLPGLSRDLRSRKGEGVTVFILDSFPEQGVIARAARDAGDDNLLLRNVNEKVKFDYSLLSGVDEISVMASTNCAAVGKDVYGRHYPILIPDHGLFIAGIVHDVAPKAKIECIRVLDDLCVGDVSTINGALAKIYNRMLSTNPDTGEKGDLYQRSVVINLSLVIPTDKEAQDIKHISVSAGGFNILQGGLFFTIKSLTELGAVIVASAGNEADLREAPGGNRPDALYPAAFGNPPYNIEDVIPVGAVDGKGQATTYSCYPGERGIATYGGEVPSVTPKDPPSSNPAVDVSDALRGIYSSVEYPPLSADPPDQYYTAPNDHAWAYWVGTSFATPIISALVARILEKKETTSLSGSVRLNVLHEATRGTTWDRLSSDPDAPATGTDKDTTIRESGRVIWAVQKCRTIDVDHEDDEDDEDEA